MEKIRGGSLNHNAGGDSNQMTTLAQEDSMSNAALAVLTAALLVAAGYTQ